MSNSSENVKIIEHIEKYTIQFVDGDLVLTPLKTETSNVEPPAPANNNIQCADEDLVLTPLKIETQNVAPAIINLDLYNKQYEELPELSPTLHTLQCSNNMLKKLPENLPKGLKQLFCNRNNLSQLPENLPDGLETIYCYSNKLTKLPEKLPEGLKLLYCYDNKLEVLPDLPTTLIELYCYNNNLHKNYPDITNYVDICSSVGVHNMKGLIEYINRRNHEMREEPEIVDETYFGNINPENTKILTCVVKNQGDVVINLSYTNDNSNQHSQAYFEIFKGIIEISIKCSISNPNDHLHTNEQNKTYIKHILRHVNYENLSIDIVFCDLTTLKRYRYINGM